LSFFQWYGALYQETWKWAKSIQDSFYKPLTPEQSQRAFKNEFDFDAPEAIDFDILVEKLRDIKAGYELPIIWTN
jgi:uridine kinase